MQLQQGDRAGEIARQLASRRDCVFAAGDHLNDFAMLSGELPCASLRRTTPFRS